MNNLVGEAGESGILDDLEARLQARLEHVGDEFLPAEEYLAGWGYAVDDRLTTPTVDYPEQIDAERYEVPETETEDSDESD